MQMDWKLFWKTVAIGFLFIIFCVFDLFLVVMSYFDFKSALFGAATILFIQYSFRVKKNMLPDLDVDP